MLNHGTYRYKQSIIERKLNQIIGVQIVLVLLLGAVLALRNHYFVKNNFDSLGYIFVEQPQMPKLFGETFGSFFLVLNAFVPISLVFMLEIIKLVQTQFIEVDCLMYGLNPSD